MVRFYKSRSVCLSVFPSVRLSVRSSIHPAVVPLLSTTKLGRIDTIRWFQPRRGSLLVILLPLPKSTRLKVPRCLRPCYVLFSSGLLFFVILYLKRALSFSVIEKCWLFDCWITCASNSVVDWFFLVENTTWFFIFFFSSFFFSYFRVYRANENDISVILISNLDDCDDCGKKDCATLIVGGGGRGREVTLLSRYEESPSYFSLSSLIGWQGRSKRLPLQQQRL